MWVQSLGWEDPLEEGMATHSSILAWRIPWTEESGKVQSIGSKRVRHNWSNLALTDWSTFHTLTCYLQFSSVEFSHSVVSDSFRPHESQHARPPCPSPTPGVHSDSHPSSRWCHPAISSSVVPFSSCPQSLPASKSFPMCQLFAWSGQNPTPSQLWSVGKEWLTNQRKHISCRESCLIWSKRDQVSKAGVETCSLRYL